ncbi:hypothetical protein Psuf_071120 [Phytohabitans suffuscus]|uniref:Uncharacterized protein n=1 Tax=Phytohabitans suffuscus TaxID=624315 RepID=A0A6F8YUQ3_9ACTN|nr:hypothetical protein [Phytohabitans suffuscus]BCB89799.1 hypothetical protein Psuf_071120 [Phytohabitans suffuscus]
MKCGGEEKKPSGDKKPKAKKATPKPDTKKTDDGTKKVALKVAQVADLLSTIVGVVPLCGVCSAAGLVFGLIAAVAFFVADRIVDAVKALIGAGLSAILGPGGRMLENAIMAKRFAGALHHSWAKVKDIENAVSGIRWIPPRSGSRSVEALASFPPGWAPSITHWLRPRPILPGVRQRP